MNRLAFAIWAIGFPLVTCYTHYHCGGTILYRLLHDHTRTTRNIVAAMELTLWVGVAIYLLAHASR